jgi:hypothetical protein
MTHSGSNRNKDRDSPIRNEQQGSRILGMNSAWQLKILGAVIFANHPPWE